MTVRAWYYPRPDRKLHAVVWMTDEQALARLEAGVAIEPVDGAEKVAADITAEIAPKWGEPGYVYDEFTMEGE